MQEFGLAGLGVMGKSLSRNLASKGFTLSLYNRYVPVEEENVAAQFITAFPELQLAQGYQDVAAFVASLQVPRKIFLMVPAGQAVDDMITQLLPHLEQGDILIDGGNSFYKDTERRYEALQTRGIGYVGTGVSGGEEGALKGPAIMAGGSPVAYAQVKKYLEAIAAIDNSGSKCCAFIGKGGAGHFVKMVHNGIEYAEMQLLAEVYAVLRHIGKHNPDDIAALLQPYLQSPYSSYLLEITIQVLQKKENNEWLIDKILDKAGNKGTGGWTTVAACELGVPVPTLTAALFARYQSEFLEERKAAAVLYQVQQTTAAVDVQQLLQAYHAARIINHHQGFHLIHAASERYQWHINMSELARVWTNGCIIRSALMADLQQVLTENKSILQHPVMVQLIKDVLTGFNVVVARAAQHYVAVPCLTSALHYLYGYVQQQSEANIIQAQRDYFGAHTYRRKDDATGRSYHTEW
jgi:6-phosphogluconate dehydrogenase